ncbi:hypothetical protein TKK_0003060 [Trichogramma kaykai]
MSDTMGSNATKAQKRKVNRLKRQAETGYSYRNKGGKRHKYDLERVQRNIDSLLKDEKLQTCKSCIVDIIVVKPIYTCSIAKNHGHICEKCRKNNCPFCRSPCVRNYEAEKKIDWDKLRIPCINYISGDMNRNTSCRHSFLSKDYYQHVYNCSQQKANAATREPAFRENDLFDPTDFQPHNTTQYESVDEFLMAERGTTYLGVRPLPHMRPFLRDINFTW